METMNINNEKSLRIQELYEKAIKKCADDADFSNFWVGTIISAILVALLVWAFAEPPMLWLKIVAILVLGLLCFFYFRFRRAIKSRMSQAVDVQELLAVNDEVKKRWNVIVALNYVVVAVVYVILHYHGNWQNDLVHCWPLVILVPICYYFDIGDSTEISEIKELLLENN